MSGLIGKQNALKDIDERLVRKLASVQCTMKEIAEVCECSVDTLERRFADIIKKERANGKAAIKNHQFRIMAKKDSPQMAIFLGQEYCEQGKQNTSSSDVNKLDTMYEGVALMRERQNQDQVADVEKEIISVESSDQSPNE